MIGIQIGKYIGCKTITVTSSQTELCKSLGATEVINYKKDKWYELLKGKEYDVCYDCVGEKDTWNNIQNVLKPITGIIIDIVVGSNVETQQGIGSMMKTVFSVGRKRLSAKFSSKVPQYKEYLQSANKPTINNVVELVNKGIIKCIVDKDIDDKRKGLYQFNVDDVLKMIDKVRSHKAHGKLVMRIADDDSK